MIPIIITGPTASGKSALAIELAKAIGGEIINADSQQLYADLPLLTAMPTDADMRACPHHLYGVLGPYDQSTAGLWLRRAAPIQKDIEGRQKCPLFVGGTGMYIRSWLSGIVEIPEIDQASKARVRDMMTDASPHAILQTRDPTMAARLEPNDHYRIARALEIFLSTGKSWATWQEGATKSPRKPAFVIYVLPERETLKQAIAARVDNMLNEGALEEVRKCEQQGIDKTAPITRVLGYMILRQVITGELDIKEARELLIHKTRQYAKRQYTWLRHQITPDFVIEERILEPQRWVPQFMDAYKASSNFTPPGA